MDREDWKELEPKIMVAGARALLSKYRVEVGVLTDKINALERYLKEKVGDVEDGEK